MYHNSYLYFLGVDYRLNQQPIIEMSLIDMKTELGLGLGSRGGFAPSRWGNPKLYLPAVPGGIKVSKKSTNLWLGYREFLAGAYMWTYTFFAPVRL